MTQDQIEASVLISVVICIFICIFGLWRVIENVFEDGREDEIKKTHDLALRARLNQRSARQEFGGCNECQ